MILTLDFSAIWDEDANEPNLQGKYRGDPQMPRYRVDPLPAKGEGVADFNIRPFFAATNLRGITVRGAPGEGVEVQEIVRAMEGIDAQARIAVEAYRYREAPTSDD